MIVFLDSALTDCLRQGDRLEAQLLRMDRRLNVMNATLNRHFGDCDTSNARLGKEVHVLNQAMADEESKRKQEAAFIDDLFDKQTARLDRHSQKLNALKTASESLIDKQNEHQGRLVALTDSVGGMVGKLCSCPQNVPIQSSPEGSSEEDFSSSSSYHVPPSAACTQCSSSVAIPPLENASPIPVPAPLSDAENVDPVRFVPSTSGSAVRRRGPRISVHPYCRRAHYPHVMTAALPRQPLGDFIDDFGYGSRTSRSMGSRDSSVGSSHVDRADSEDRSSGGQLASELADAFPGPSCARNDSDEWVPIIGRAEQGGGGSFAGFAAGRRGSPERKVSGSPEA